MVFKFGKLKIYLNYLKLKLYLFYSINYKLNNNNRELTMNLEEIKFSDYAVASLTPSPVNRMMTEFATSFRDDVDINFGVGYVNEDTIPKELIEEAFHEVLLYTDKYRLALNYGGAQGSPNLIESIRQFYANNRIGGLDRKILSLKDIIIGPDGATSILESIAQVMKTGIVITSDPMYYSYCNFLERKGFQIIAIPEDNNGIQTDLLREKIDRLRNKKQDISFVYIVTINNPTSTILLNERRRKVVEIISDLSKSLNRKIPLFFDKAYEGLVHDPEVPQLESGLLYDELGIAYDIGTLSKILAPALRIGYLIGPKGSLINCMIQRTSDVGFSAPLINQEIASYLLDHYASTQTERVIKGYRKKAMQVKKWIEEELGDCISECRGGQAGFYFYLTMQEGIYTNEDSSFYKFLTRTTGDKSIDGPSDAKFPRVVYIPGEFFVHSKGDLVEVGKRQLRLSYGYENLEKMHKGIKYMKSAAKYAKDLTH